MKRLLLFATAMLMSVMAMADEVNPVPRQEAVVRVGKARFTVLTPEMIRIQYSDVEQFEDRATFAVVNRRLPVPRFKQERKGVPE